MCNIYVDIAYAYNFAVNWFVVFMLLHVYSYWIHVDHWPILVRTDSLHFDCPGGVTLKDFDGYNYTATKYRKVRTACLTPKWIIPTIDCVKWFNEYTILSRNEATVQNDMLHYEHQTLFIRLIVNMRLLYWSTVICYPTNGIQPLCVICVKLHWVILSGGVNMMHQLRLKLGQTNMEWFLTSIMRHYLNQWQSSIGSPGKKSLYKNNT